MKGLKTGKIRRGSYKFLTLLLLLSMLLSSFTVTTFAADAVTAFNAVYAANTIQIDGMINEADWQLNQQLSQGTGNNTAKLGTLWDENNLYIAVDVTDANVVNSGAEYPWNDDSVEIYIDGNLTRGSYDGHTVQYIFRYNDDAVYKYSNDTATTNGIAHKTVKTDKGYVMEIAIPWSSIGGITVAEGKTIGFTAHVNDKDVNDKNAEVTDLLALTPNFANDWAGSSDWALMTLVKLVTISYDFNNLGMNGQTTQPGWSIAEYGIVNDGNNVRDQAYGLQIQSDPGQYVVFNFDVPAAGPYEIKFSGAGAGGGGIAGLMVDGVEIGQYNFFSVNYLPVKSEETYGIFQLTQGTHKLKLLALAVPDDPDAWGANMYPAVFTLVQKPFVPELDTVSLAADYTNLISGQTSQLSVKGIMNNGQLAYLGSAAKTFTSSDASAAAVDANGSVTAVAPGTADITADVTLNNVTKSGTIQVTVISAADVNLTLTSDRTELVVGQTARLSLTGSCSSGAISLDGAAVSYSAGDGTIASIDDSGIVTALKPGAASITASASFGDDTKTAVLDINVADIVLRDVTVTAVRPVIFIGQTTEIKVCGKLNNDETADLSTAAITYCSGNEATATVYANGVVTAVSPGKANINVDVTLNGVTRGNSVEITVIDPESITSTKTRSTIYTPAKVTAASQNIEKYNWAKALKDAAVTEADKYVALGNDYLWNLVTAQTLPRSFSTSLEYACPVCGKQMYADYGLYGWQLDPINKPWKLVCPECKTIFPTNDFGAYYKSGLDEHGIFQPELADKSLLKNTLYPEKGEKWGVDDGFGWTDENGHKFTFIAYYNHWALWYDQSGPGSILKAIIALRDAYVCTGDMKYVRAGTILLDRIADVYPDFDCAAYKWSDGFVNSHGYTYQGKVLGSIWEPMMVTEWIKAYDAFFPAIDDQETIDFLSAKAQQYQLANPKITAAAIRRNIEDNILRQVLPAIKKAQMDGNFGMHQSTLATTAVVLDNLPETKEMLDFDFQAGVRESNNDGTWDGAWSWSGGDILRTLVDDVDRDGDGNEASPGYNSLWLGQLKNVADVLDGYDTYPAADLYQNVKYAKMYSAMYPLTLAGKYTAQIGDTGGCGNTGLIVNVSDCVTAFQKYGDPIYAQLAYFLNGNTINGIHGDIFTADPEKAASDIKTVIDTYGELNLKSTNLTGFGFAVLRDGENFIKDSGIPYNFPGLAVSENTSGFKLYESSGTIQFENNTDAGERITFKFDVPTTDTYEMDLLPFKATSYGIYDIKIDGQTIKQDYDFYGSSGASSTMDVLAGEVQIDAGTHEITFECTGKRDESTNYKLGVRKMLLLNKEAQTIRDNALLKGDTQRDIWMYYGRNTGHGHKDTLNLGMHAYGLDIAPENGYPEQTGPYPSRMGWTQNTVSHNTVVVDNSKQKDEYVGIPHHFDDSDMVKLIDVEAPNVYTQTQMYRRTTALIKVDDVNSYTVDFFRVKGGNDHHFSFHGYEGPVTTEGLNLTAQSGGTYAGTNVEYGQFYDGPINDWSYMGSGFQYLYNVQKDTAPSDTFSVDWNIVDGRHVLPTDENIHLRLTMLTKVDDVAICDGNPPASPGNPESLKYMIAHRSGTNLDSMFTSVLEPYKANRYIESISAATVKANGQIVDKDVTAVKTVFKNGRVDYIVNALDNNTIYTIDDKFQFKGFFGMYSEKDGNPVYTYVNDGTFIGKLETPKASFTGTVVDFTKDMSRANEITVQFDSQDTIPDITGKYIYIENDGERNASYEIKGIKSQDVSKVVLDIGDITTIRKWADPNDFSKGYIYDIAAGEKFVIPLASSLTISLAEAALSSDKNVLERDDTVKLTITGKLSDGSDANLENADVEYVSSDPAVAAVSSDGTVTAGNAGSANIYAKVTLNGVTVQSNSVTIKVTVSIASIRRLIAKYTASEDLKGPMVSQLTNSLDQVEHQYDKGSKDQAVKLMGDFIKHSNNPDLAAYITEAAKNALEADARALISIWSK